MIIARPMATAEMKNRMGKYGRPPERIQFRRLDQQEANPSEDWCKVDSTTPDDHEGHDEFVDEVCRLLPLEAFEQDGRKFDGQAR